MSPEERAAKFFDDFRGEDPREALAAAIRAAETEARARALNEAASMAEEISGEPPWPDFACELRRLAGEGAGRG